MDRDQLLRQLMGVFLGELDEHVRAMNRNLLALEQFPPGPQKAEILQELFRTAHSLKGASRAVNVKPIETACHSVEEILAALSEGSREVDGQIIQYLFAAADALEDAGRRLREGHSLDGAPVHALSDGRLPAPAPAPYQESTPSLRLSHPSAELHDSTSAVVRVPASKLDALMAESGALLLSETQLAERIAEADRLHEHIVRWRSDWQCIDKPLRKLAASAAPHRRLPQSFTATLGRMKETLGILEKDFDRLLSGMAADRRALAQATSALDAGVCDIRMVPFAEVCQGLVRVVRDLAREQRKEIEVIVTGGEVEIDRSLLESLKDPVMHLVRNAVDHGIEKPAERIAAAKPASGRIAISAALLGAQIEVCIADDGRGLDEAAIRERARTEGLPQPQDHADLMRLVFQPGFTTSATLTSLSGRGVGLDAVKSRVEALHGHIDVESAPAAGVRFRLTMPLTVTTIPALLVEAAGQVFAFATTHVDRLWRIRPDDMQWMQGRAVIAIGSAPLPAAALHEILGLPGRESRGGAGAEAVIVHGHGRSVAVVVDDLLGAHEILVKSLGHRLKRVRHISGATILPDGRIALIVNAGELVEAVMGQSVSSLKTGNDVAVAPKRRILIADDSVTMRSLSKSILEGAGFEVLSATDGAEALRLLHDNGADLVVSDIEMPRMDGFALTEAIRSSKRLGRLPVILLTGLGSEDDKMRGLAAGADAYLVKSAFNQAELIATIEQLL